MEASRSSRARTIKAFSSHVWAIMAKIIICLTFAIIRQHFIRILNLCEPLSSCRVILVLVWVVLLS